MKDKPLSDNIIHYQAGDYSGFDHEFIYLKDVKEAVEKLKEEIKERSVFRVVDGKAPIELREAFREGEDIGREEQKELCLELIGKIFGRFE